MLLQVDLVPALLGLTACGGWEASGGSGFKNEQEGGRAEGQEEGSKHRNQHVQRPWGN